MAITEQLIIEAVNKTGPALGKLQKDLRGVNTATNSLSSGFSRLQTLIIGAAAAFGGFQAAKGFLNTARQLENLGIQLKFITGSADEGAKALDIVREAAANSAFQLQEMAQAAPLLLTVADSTEELNQLLAITGDIAVAAGLDFVTAAEQLQRSFSGGIAAADLFRERGVRSLLGFQEGVQYSAQQTKELIVKGFEDGTFAIAGAASEMATSFDGAVSMLQDGLFQFQAQVMDSGPFEMLKSMVAIAVEAIGDNFDSIQDAATAMGNKIVEVVKSSIIGFGMMLDAVVPIFELVHDGISGLMTITDNFHPTIKALGIIGFLMLGIKGKLVVIAIGAVFNKIKELFVSVMDFLASSKEKVATFVEVLGMDEYAAKLRKNAEDIRASNQKILDGIKATGEEMANQEQGGDALLLRIQPGFEFDGGESMGKYETMMRGFVAKLENITEERNKKAIEQSEKTNKKNTESAQQALSKEGEILKKKLTQLQESLMSEVEVVENTRAKRLQIVNDNLKAGNLLEENALILRNKIHEQAEQELNKIKQDAEEERLKNIEQNFRKEMQLRGVSDADIEKRLELEKASRTEQARFILDNTVKTFEALGQQNKKAFQAYKAFAIAQTVIDTYKSAQSAFTALVGIPFIGPALAVSAAAAAVAAGFARVNAIRSQSYSGRREGGPVQMGRSFVVGEEGPEIFTPNMNGRITPNSSLGGNVNITFEVGAIDSQDLQARLADNRDVIVSIVNEAVNQQGRRSII